MFAGSAAADDSWVTKNSRDSLLWPGLQLEWISRWPYRRGLRNIELVDAWRLRLKRYLSDDQHLRRGGSFLAGIQGGYNYMLPNRIVVGAEADATFPNFPSLLGLSTGPSVNFTSPTFGAENFSEAMLSSRTIRGRIGYAPEAGCFMRRADSPGPITSKR